MTELPLHTLLEHLRWADRAVLSALRAAPPHPKAAELFAHVVGAEETWLARLERRAPRVPVWPQLGVEETAQLADEVHAALAAWLERAAPAALAEEVPYANSAGQRFATRAIDMFTQLVMHGSYHRGQIALLLRQSGAEPAATDYITFVRGVPAATRQPPA